MMKWLVALLMMVNVAIFLMLGGDRDVGVAVTNELHSDVNKEGMLLIDELADFSESVETGSPNNRGTPGHVVSDHAAQLDRQPASDVLHCYRIGPFKENDYLQEVLGWAKTNGLNHRQVASDAREIQATRVYLGPFSKDELGQTVQLLIEKQLDHYSFKNDDGGQMISLGFFMQTELADRFIQHLNRLGINARYKTELQMLNTLNWVELSIEGDKVQQLMNRRWSARNIILSSIKC